MQRRIDTEETMTTEGFTTVEYSRLKSGPNYENEKIGVTALVQEGETPEQALDRCRAFVNGQLDLTDERREAQERLWRVNGQVEQATQRLGKLEAAWKQAAAILASHGITPETAPSLRWDWPQVDAPSEPSPDDTDDVPY